jgi:hypothetical protein
MNADRMRMAANLSQSASEAFTKIDAASLLRSRSSKMDGPIVRSPSSGLWMQSGESRGSM